MGIQPNYFLVGVIVSRRIGSDFADGTMDEFPRSTCIIVDIFALTGLPGGARKQP
jgi:hypothetical protein